MTDDPSLNSDDPAVLTPAVLADEGLAELPITEQISALRNRATDARARADRLSRASHRLAQVHNHALARPNLTEHRRP